MKGFIILGCILCCTGCMSLVEKSGQVLDGSVFAEKTLTAYWLMVAGKEDQALELKQVQGDDQTLLVLTLEAFPFLQLRGSAPGPEGDFLLRDLHFLGSSLSGWNEFTLDISGTGVFTVQGNRGILRIQTPIEPVQISRGKILHRGSRLTGDQALTTLRNRYERIRALTEWMHTQEAPELETQEAFEAYWKPLLLPELVSGKQRPPAFTKAPPLWVRAEDIAWNRKYTEFLLPEELWILRNSGSLLRDWEEALTWIYFQYQWDYILGLIADTYIMKQHIP